MNVEYIALAIFRELMETQERTFKQTIYLYTNCVREEVKSARKTVEDLETSLMFSQKDTDDLKGNIYETEDKLHSLEDSFARSENEVTRPFTSKNTWRTLLDAIT